MAGKEQREDVGHEAGLGEEDDEPFDSMAERCPFNCSGSSFSLFNMLLVTSLKRELNNYY